MNAIVQSWNKGQQGLDAEAAQGWLKLAGEAASAGGVLPLDPRNPDHSAHIESRLGDDAHLAAHFPRKAAMMAATSAHYDLNGIPQGRTLLEMSPEQASHRPLHSYVGIAHFAAHPEQGTIVATGIVSHLQTLHALEMVLEIVDADSGERVASTSIAPQFNTTYQRATATAPLPADGKPRNLVAGLTTNFVVDGEPSATPMLATAQLSTSAGITIVTPYAPIPVRHPGAAIVKIAIDRDGSDVDYSFQGIQPPNEIMVPFAGEAQLASGYVVAQPPCQTGSLVLIARAGGVLPGGSQFALAQSDVIAAFAASQGVVATWSMGPDWQQTFGNVSQGPSIFDVTLQATLNLTSGGNPTTAVLTVSSTAPATSGGTLCPINIMWGCLAPGTLVRLAEGGERRIEDIVPGDLVVADGTGRTARVAGVTTGTERAPMWRLSAGGRSLLATHNHPVLTTAGPRAASEIRTGDLVLTEDGPATVESNEAEDYDGPIFNLVLQSPEGAVPLHGDSFVAEGIVTGDNRMQNLLPTLAPEPPLPDEWRFDAANAERLAAGLPLVALARS